MFLVNQEETDAAEQDKSIGESDLQFRKFKKVLLVQRDPEKATGLLFQCRDTIYWLDLKT